MSVEDLVSSSDGEEEQEEEDGVSTGVAIVGVAVVFCGVEGVRVEDAAAGGSVDDDFGACCAKVAAFLAHFLTFLAEHLVSILPVNPRYHG